MFVTPSELSSGEAMTVLAMAQDIVRHGGQCACLASPFTAQFLTSELGVNVRALSADADHNRRVWERFLRVFRPEVVIFADYPFLFFSNGASRLADDGWVNSVEALDALTLTLDHLGYAQRSQRVFFGPAHLSMHSEVTPPLPRSMQVLLPCPMNEPGPVPDRTGTPFSYLTLGPNGSGEIQNGMSNRGGTGPFLVVHVTPTWAWQIAGKWELPHYRFFSDLLQRSFEGLSRPVRVVSVNHGSLLTPSQSGRVRIENTGILIPDEYQRLLMAADLVISDNAVSSTVGRVVCAMKPVARIHNTRRLLEIFEDQENWSRSLALAMERCRPGAVFPFEVFPLWNAADLEQLGLFRGNSVTETMEAIEMFGGEATCQRLRQILIDDVTRTCLRRRQRQYVDRVRSLPRPWELLATLLAAVPA